MVRSAFSPPGKSTNKAEHWSSKNQLLKPNRGGNTIQVYHASTKIYPQNHISWHAEIGNEMI